MVIVMSKPRKGIVYIEGDLIKLAKEGMFDIIAHGCNCMCTMGAGIARQIAEEWPEVARRDKLTTPGDKRKLGTISPVFVEQGDLIVVNMYTQLGFGAGLQVDYTAIDLAFSHLTTYTRHFMHEEGFLPEVGIPKIGAGLGGGDWDRIEKIILKHELFNLTVVEYKP